MNNNEKLLSIIVPVYNVEDYLRECLNSLVSQNIACNEYEIICVDDGSTDKSGEILDLYAEKYSNIVIVHKENGGVSSARNCGIDIAKGQYIWFVDADDFIKENCLSVVKAKIIENKYDSIRIKPYAFIHDGNKFDVNSVIPEMCQREIKNFSVTYIFRKEYVVNNKIYLDTRIAYAEDAIFMLQLSPFLRSEVRIEDMVVYFYRQRPGSAMSYSLIKKIQSRINGALVCEEIIQGKRIGDIEGAYKFKYISVVKIMEMIFKLPKEERKEIENELRNNNLFPLKYNSKYTPKFRNGKAKFIKKIRNTLIDFSYTQIGFLSLKFYNFIFSLFRKIKSTLLKIIDSKNG